jgi:hypothetical protein
MKKWMLGTGLLMAVALAVTLACPKQAKAVSVPYAQSSTIALYWEGTVAAGALVASPVFKMENITECVIAADNSLGGSTRNVLVDYLLLDGVTIASRTTIAVATTLRWLVGIGSVSQTASLPANITVIPVATGKRMQFSLSAAGAAAGSLQVACR